MESMITYFTRAENDFQFLKFAYDHGRTDDAMGYLSQNICERYLKHVIDTFCDEIDTSNVLRTHSIRVLSKFIKKNLPDFSCNWDKILKCEGYYFSARYPGNDAIELDSEDIKECWEAVVEARCCVNNYLQSHEKEEENVFSDEIVNKINSF